MPLPIEDYALVGDDLIVATELGHLHCKKGRSYEDFLGKKGFKRLGKKKWRRKVRAVVQGFSDALLPDDIVIGGGHADRLKRLPPRTRRGDNAAAFLGGFRLWEEPTHSIATSPAGARLVNDEGRIRHSALEAV